jgi:hypothetical protein
MSERESRTDSAWKSGKILLFQSNVVKWLSAINGWRPGRRMCKALLLAQNKSSDWLQWPPSFETDQGAPWYVTLDFMIKNIAAGAATWNQKVKRGTDDSTEWWIDCAAERKVERVCLSHQPSWSCSSSTTTQATGMEQGGTPRKRKAEIGKLFWICRAAVILVEIFVYKNCHLYGIRNSGIVEIVKAISEVPSVPVLF